MSAIAQPAFFSPRAWAACNPAIINQDNQVVNCNGNDADGVDADVNGNIQTTVNIPNGASITPLGAIAVNLNQDSKLLMSGNGTIITVDANAHGALLEGGAATVTLEGSASIMTSGDLAEGIFANGADSKISLSDASSISTFGINAVGIFASGGGEVTLNGTSQIDTSGVYGMGVRVINGQSTVTLNDQARIDTQGKGAAGVYIGAVGGTITLNNSAAISTQGEKGFGAVVAGQNGTILLNDQSNIETFGVIAFGAFGAGDNSTITMNEQSKITTHADFSHGILVKGDNGFIALNDSSNINTAGLAAHGVLIQGNGGTIAMSGTAKVTAAGIGFGLAVDGDGVNVTNDVNNIVSSGVGAVAFTNGSNSLDNRGLLQSTFLFAIWGDNNAGFSDTINNVGTIISGGGTAIALFDGNDFLNLNTGSTIVGTMDGGLGFDTVTLNGSGSENDNIVNFEDAVMNGGAWSLSGTSSFGNSLSIVNGRLAIDGSVEVTGALGTINSPNGILAGIGQLKSDVTSAGIIAPGNGIGTLSVIGDVTQTGGSFDIEFNQNSGDLLNIAGSLTLANNPVVNATALSQISSLNRVIIHADNGIFGPIGDLNYVGNGAVSMIQEPNDIRLVILDGTTTVALNTAGLKGAMDYLDAVTGAQLYVDNRDPGRSRRLWGRGFGHFGVEEARDGNLAYDYNTAGTAIGGDAEVADGLSLGLSFGYAHTNADLVGNFANADIDSEYAALYARYELGNFFATGVLTGGLQQVDIERGIDTAGGRDVANGLADGYIFGGSFQAGVNLDFDTGWRLTPSAGVLYQHQIVDDYRERGAGAANVKMKAQESDAIRISGQLNLAKVIDFEGFEITPHVSAGIANEITKGGKARGVFSDGTDFDFELQDDNQIMGLTSAGIGVSLDTGLSFSLDYQGRFANDTTDHGILAGVSFKW